MVGLCPLVAWVRFFILSDALFLLINRLMLPAKAPRTYNIAVPVRKVLWQHVGDLRPLGSGNEEKWPARAEARMRDPELVCPTASH